MTSLSELRCFYLLVEKRKTLNYDLFEKKISKS